MKALNEVGGDYNIKCPVVEFADFYSRGPNAQVWLLNPTNEVVYISFEFFLKTIVNKIETQHEAWYVDNILNTKLQTTHK